MSSDPAIDLYPHGLPKGYRKGCRCDRCRAAWSRYNARLGNWASGGDALEPDPGARAAGMVAERFEAADDARMRELDRLISRGYANTDPSKIPPEELGAADRDVVVGLDLARGPDCSVEAVREADGTLRSVAVKVAPPARPEQLQAEIERKRDELARVLLAPIGPTPAAAAPPPTQETTMACPECGSPTCHKLTCSRRPAAKAAPAPARKEARHPGELEVPARLRPPRRGRATDVLGEVEAVRQRADERLKAILEELREHEEAGLALREEQAKLLRFLRALEGEPVSAVG